MKIIYKSFNNYSHIRYMKRDTMYPEKVNHGGEFYTHLQGIRGVAILLILVFHLGTTGVHSPISLPGGYLGVEMFLVLSGYLLALGFTKRFSGVWEFTQKKLLRIMFPVSVTVVLALTGSVLTMDYEDMLIAATTGITSICGVTNMLLSESSAGYFAEETSFNPLLHMWYIAITLQIYIWAYIAYRLLRNCRKWIILPLMGTVAVCSLVWCYCHEWRIDFVEALHLPEWIGSNTSMYYSTTARLWEPIAGAAVLLLPSCRRWWACSLLSLISVAAITYSVWNVQAWSMPVVVLATVLLIKYLPDSKLSPLVDNRAFRWLGKISFSIYLVHMPIYVCYKCATMYVWSIEGALLMLVVGILVGFVFYCLIEKNKVGILKLLVCMSIASIFACVLVYTQGLKQSLNVTSNQIERQSWKNPRACVNSEIKKGFDSKAIKRYDGWHYTNCCSKSITMRPWALQLGDASKTPTFVMLGDSQVQQLITGMDALASDMSVSGIYVATIVMPYWNRYRREHDSYYWDETKAKALFKWLKIHPELKTVFIGQLWSRTGKLTLRWNKEPIDDKRYLFYDNAWAFGEFLRQLKAIGKDVVVFAPTPVFNSTTPVRYARFLHRNEVPVAQINHPDYIVTKEAFLKQFDKMFKALHKYEQQGLCTVVHHYNPLFKDGKAYMVEGGKILYRDHCHVSIDSAVKMIQSVDELIKKSIIKNE